jgi:DNA-binding LacI/PurR family transcriptional regulator
MKIRLDEIARRVGVSRATVSRAINGSTLVSPKTAAKVRAAMDELGFDRTALRSGPKPCPLEEQRPRIGSIALIVVGSTADVLREPAMSRVIHEAQTVAKSRGLTLILDEMLSPDAIPLCVQRNQVDGVLLLGPANAPVGLQCIEALQKVIPGVHLLGPEHQTRGIDHVSVNDVEVGALAFRTLVDKGCRSMAIINTQSHFHEALLVRGRAFSDRCREAGIPVKVIAPPTGGRDPSQYWPQPSATLTDPGELPKLLGDLPSPTGIFLVIDHEAPAVHAVLSKAGLLLKNRCHLLVAGATPAYLDRLKPRPLVLDIPFRSILGIAVDRLIYAALHRPPEGLTFLVVPRLA